MVQCACGRRAVIRTSWTNINPGRRFYSCPQKDSNCPFIDWVDPPMCPRSVLIIPGLLRGRNTLEANLRQAEQDRARLRSYLYLTWIGVALFVLVKMSN
ncbi:zinc finger, GRF-type [Artemisia annua]|uniref:Zinc finger, GRF-type n=1 Tax=Artemisia annua TaxID=35608 RepID=A0A2U1KPY6_ARTAN|nr:zinc finger, GRF-type [Artemisia annua]